MICLFSQPNLYVTSCIIWLRESWVHIFYTRFKISLLFNKIDPVTRNHNLTNYYNVPYDGKVCMMWVGPTAWYQWAAVGRQGVHMLHPYPPTAPPQPLSASSRCPGVNASLHWILLQYLSIFYRPLARVNPFFQRVNPVYHVIKLIALHCPRNIFTSTSLFPVAVTSWRTQLVLKVSYCIENLLILLKCFSEKLN